MDSVSFLLITAAAALCAAALMAERAQRTAHRRRMERAFKAYTSRRN